MNESQNKITFADVAGVEEAKDDVEEIIEFFQQLFPDPDLNKYISC